MAARTNPWHAIRQLSTAPGATVATVATVCIAAALVAACSSRRDRAGTRGDSNASADSSAESPPHAAPASTATPAGWLYTRGNKIYVSNGQGGGSVWVGRGVNVDDVFLCGFNCLLDHPTAGETLETLVETLVQSWKPSLLRISLWMASCQVQVEWTADPALYASPMTRVIEAAGRAGAYVLVSLRSDLSMIGYDDVDGDPEATGLPSDGRNTPDRVLYPQGTDETYIALVDRFAHSGFVLFGLTNEPGGDKLPPERISAAMSHAVRTIRTEEDRLGVPHHVVTVQGTRWTADVGAYARAPLPFDNVTYEVHGYPPSEASYSYPNIPVILGEYGEITAAKAPSFYADLEAKQIPNIAWDFDSFSDCGPDLVVVNENATDLVPTLWGGLVRSYLLAHAR